MKKSYKEMSYKELLEEEKNVKTLLATNKNIFAQKQNRKYLSKIQKELKDYELLRQNSRNGLRD